MVRPRSLTTLAARRAPVGENGPNRGDLAALATCQILVIIREFWVASVDATRHRVAAAHPERCNLQAVWVD